MKGEPADFSGASSPRLTSLDQFRGFAVWGMLLVNFLGGFAACPEVLRHHNTYCSYADLVMPQFLFAVGFAFRLTFLRNVAKGESAAAYARTARRLAGLALVAIVIYAPGRRAETWEQLQQLGLWGALAEPLKRDWFQTLMHIAATTLWLLPVIGARTRTLVAYAAASGLVHVGLSFWFNFEWTNTSPNAIDGGPLGFLTWSIPAATGAICYDAFVARDNRPSVASLGAAALGLMFVGYLLSCPSRWYEGAPVNSVSPKLAASPVAPPDSAWSHAAAAIREGRPADLFIEPPLVPPPSPLGDLGRSHEMRPWNYWMMSQRAGTLSYLVFSAGAALAVFLAFHLACDLGGWRSRALEVFGANALAAYVLHMLVDTAVSPFTTRDAPAWYMWTACALFLATTFVMVRALDRAGVRLRV